MSMKRFFFLILSILFSISLSAQLDAGDDQYICKGDIAQLNATGASNYHWTSIPPDPTLSNPDIPNPTVQPDTTTMYIVSSIDTGMNRVPNGDFELGNTGFTSEYIYNPVSLWNPGTYAVVSDAHSVHPNFFCNADHTTGNGLMMCVNGATTSNTIVWSVTVDSINPNTEYQLSAWVSSLSPLIVAVLQFKINGVQVGQPLTANLFTCTWKPFSETWDSGDDTVATITIIDQNTADNLNDFALDDISLNEIIVQYDTVMVYVTDPPTSTFDLPGGLCSADTATVTYTGNGADTAEYHWDFDGGTIIIGSGQGPYRIYWPAPGTKNVSLWVEDSCVSDTSTNSITINQNPTASVTANATSIPYGTSTFLHGSMEGEPGPLSFDWQPSDSLIDPSSLNPETILLEATTTFWFTVTDESSLCPATDSITITVTGGPLMITGMTVSPDTICEGESTDIQLFVSGGSENYTATWTSNPPGFNHEGPEMSVTVSPSATTTYIVSVNDGFNTTPEDSVQIIVLSQVVISGQPADVQVAPGQQATFSVTAQNVQTYRWQYSPDNGTTWTDLADDAAFTGTSTSQLIINPTTSEMNNWLFRCLLSGQCDPQITDSALLIITQSPDFISGLQDVEACEESGFELPYHVSGFFQVTGLQLVLQFNDQQLSFAGLSEVVPELSQDIQFSSNGNRIQINWSSQSPVTFNTGTAFKLDFTALAGSTSQLTWVVDECWVTNNMSSSPSMIFTDASVLVNPLPRAPLSVTADPDSLSITDQVDIILSTEGGSGDNLIWTTGSCSGEETGRGTPLKIIRPDETTTYFAKWKNLCGESECREVTVVVAGEFDIYVPNAFSPDGDGLNDEFNMVSPAMLYSYRLEIFNRWGQQIFETSDQNRGWDGTYKGKKSPAGVYVWKITFQLTKEGSGSGPQRKSGTVMMVE
ncbi:MAG TPA: gliding motility-associated C-terminal domain-containing protein [Bacteroidetes bacterium]|nr:gliding motility-associated C-terminal domain-containing protein [Bacteroidota bacterium]